MDENYVIEKLKTLTPDLKKLDEFNKKDCYSEQYDLYVEIKTRTRHFDTLTIDKTKWDHLVQFRRCRYVVGTPKGLWSWDLKKIPEPEWFSRSAPSSTYYFQNIDNVIKTFGYLNISDAKDLTYLLNP